MAVLIGKKAPDFNAIAVVDGEDFHEGFTLSQFEGNKYVLLFFYPLDFTFVCPTELHAFQEKLKEFEDRDVQVVAVSIDSHFSHYAWLNTPKDKGGIEGVTYPLVADITKTIAMDYDVLAGDYEYVENENGEFRLSFTGQDAIAYRGLFLIDKQGIVRHQVVNDLPLGRNVDEALRMVDALRHFENKGEVCPANWSEGEEAMKESKESVSEYLAKR